LINLQVNLELAKDVLQALDVRELARPLPYLCLRVDVKLCSVLAKNSKPNGFISRKHSMTTA
jgi:hypothetical protein